MELRNMKSIRNKEWIRLALICGILVLLNLISTRLHKRLDLTTEKRFSLSDPTKKMLHKLDDVAFFEVYLKGKFPAGFQKLSESTLNILNEFKEEGGSKIRYRFLNPVEGLTGKERQEQYIQLDKQGVHPVMLHVRLESDEGYADNVIFPSVKISYHQKDTVISLMDNTKGTNLDNDQLYYSEIQLEYKLISALKGLRDPDRKKVALLVGHDNQIGYHTLDMLSTLEMYYDLDTLDLTKGFEIPAVYSAAIVLAPTTKFEEQEKFKLDQYVMHGGKMLWAIDPMRYAMDSLRNSSATMAIPYELNLEDLLFRYGVRINPDYIEDYHQANPIPVTVGELNGKPDIRLLPWSYYPFCIPDIKHPVVNNLDAVMCMMASSIDTIADPSLKKTILLHSSVRSRRVPAPVRVSLSNLKFVPTADMFKEKDIPVAVLVEGIFQSIYAHRMDQEFKTIYRDSLKREMLAQSEKPGAMIVMSDANIFSNDFMKDRPTECGYYKYTDRYFANKSFILNCLEYLIDNDHLLEARNKVAKLRLLDNEKVKEERTKWQIINIGLPSLVVLIFGSAYFFFRRKKYAS